MKKVILIIVVLAIIVGGYGYYQFNRKAENLESKQADLTTNVQNFVAEYQKDEAAANTKYLDKVVEVTGKVAEVRKDEKGAVKLSFVSDDPMSTVIAEMDQSDVEKALKLQANSEVTIKGVCTGSLGDIICSRSVIK
ncbi:MAG: hypothetical protein JNK41_14035 [Saprospiraceae bacterium]|jgi:RPA family protein|nr:hypothetical protein [Saprospiraceae bacterium]